MIDYKFIRVGKSSYKYIKELYLKAFNLKQSMGSIQKKYDTHFFVGTIHGHPHTWIIIGLFYPPKFEHEATLRLFD